MYAIFVHTANKVAQGPQNDKGIALENEYVTLYMEICYTVTGTLNTNVIIGSLLFLTTLLGDTECP